MLKLSFTPDTTITVITCPNDMRAGFGKLSMLALMAGIRVDQGGQTVVFVSRSRHVCKVISWDSFGTYVVTRRLHTGTFEKFLSRIDGPATQPLTAQELECFLNGGRIFGTREQLL